jgi:carbon-monoxide dehydrogenase medium subunit
MKPPDFAYERPETLDEALALLGADDGEARPLAGGQSLMPMMNFRLAAPDCLVDLNGIAGLTGIGEEGEAIRIGAMTRYAALERSDLVAEHLPLVKSALPHIAHPAIRNRGTIGGSVALADPAAEMPAVLLALGATIVAVSAAGERSIAADDFFLGLYETALKPGEIVSAVSIPKAGAGSHYAFQELARRHGDYAMAGVAVAASSAEPLSGLRIALFGVSDRTLRATGAEDALNGSAAGDQSALDSAISSLDAVEFHGDLNASAATKRHLAGVLLRRAIAELA